MRTLKTEYFTSFLIKDSWCSYFDSHALAPRDELPVHIRGYLADEVIGTALHILDEANHAESTVLHEETIGADKDRLRIRATKRKQPIVFFCQS